MPAIKMNEKTGFDLMMDYLKSPDKVKSKTQDENTSIVNRMISTKVSKPRSIKFK